MSADSPTKIGDCRCLAVRQAARHVTASYDQFLAPAGLRTTQFSILAKLKRQGPMTINALAAEIWWWIARRWDATFFRWSGMA